MTESTWLMYVGPVLMIVLAGAKLVEVIKDWTFQWSLARTRANDPDYRKSYRCWWLQEWVSFWWWLSLVVGFFGGLGAVGVYLCIALWTGQLPH